MRRFNEVATEVGKLIFCYVFPNTDPAKQSEIIGGQGSQGGRFVFIELNGGGFELICEFCSDGCCLSCSSVRPEKVGIVDRRSIPFITG